MDPQTYDRVFKPSAGEFSKMIKAYPTVRSVSTIQPQDGF